MESKLKQFVCQRHPSESLVRTTFDLSPSKVLFCVECLVEIKPEFKVVSLHDYFNQFLELNRKLPNFASATTETSEGIPDELNELLNSESEALVKLKAHIETEKTKVDKYYDNVKEELLRIIDEKKTNALSSLDDQLQTIDL